MRSKSLILATFVFVITGFFLQHDTIGAAEYSIKSYSGGYPNFAFETDSYFAYFREQLFSTSNFGPSGTVKDVEFSGITQVIDITEQNMQNTDIFVLLLPHSTPYPINSLQAQILKNFVDGGGSLIIAADGGGLPSASLFSSFYNLIYSGSSASGTTSIINHTYAPELTDGPFGSVGSCNWGSNATSRITIENSGDATVIDSFGMVAAINPTSTSGSVVFYADADNFRNISLYSGDWERLAMNLFAYSAHSSNVGASAVPEPTSIILLGLGVVGLIRKRIKK